MSECPMDTMKYKRLLQHWRAARHGLSEHLLASLEGKGSKSVCPHFGLLGLALSHICPEAPASLPEA
jgi:hypothetical protein